MFCSRAHHCPFFISGFGFWPTGYSRAGESFFFLVLVEVSLKCGLEASVVQLLILKEPGLKMQLNPVILVLRVVLQLTFKCPSHSRTGTEVFRDLIDRTVVRTSAHRLDVQCRAPRLYVGHKWERSKSSEHLSKWAHPPWRYAVITRPTLQALMFTPRLRQAARSSRVLALMPTAFPQWEVEDRNLFLFVCLKPKAWTLYFQTAAFSVNPFLSSAFYSAMITMFNPKTHRENCHLKMRKINKSVVECCNLIGLLFYFIFFCIKLLLKQLSGSFILT